MGRQLVPLLVEAGHEVVVGTRSAQNVKTLQTQGAKGVLLDVFDREAVAAAIGEAAPQAIFHQLTALAGGSPVDNARIRREGTRNLVDAALRAGVTRMVAQSISWAYEPGTGPAVEATPLDTGAPDPRAVSVGGITALESAVAEIDRHVVLRYGTFYGPSTWYAPADFIAGKLADGALPANDGVSSFVHVHDAAQAALQALDWPNGPVNIVDDEPAAAHEWVPVLARELNRPVPERTSGGAGWERGADNTLARSLGWRPARPTWRTGFADQG